MRCRSWWWMTALLSRKHITRVLHSLGIRRIDHAEDGLRGLEMIEQNYYDFIVTDYNMPRMDGKELIDHIRNRVDPVPRCPC